MPLSLGARAQLGFFSAVGLVIVVGVTAFVSLGRLNNEVQDALMRDLLFARAGEAIKIYFLETRRAEQNYLVFGQDRDIKEYEFFLGKLQEALREGKGVTRQETTLDKYHLVEQYLQQYEQIFARLLTVPSEARDEIRHVSEELSEVGHRISTLADEIADAKWAEIAMQAQDASRIEAVAKRNMGMILAFTGMSSLLLGLYWPRKIVNPMRRLTALLKRVQEEEIRVNLEVTTNDEIGELGRLINRMMDQVRVFADLKSRKITAERRLEVLSNLLEEGVILADDNGQVYAMSAAALDFFGLSQSDVAGRSLKEIPLDEPFRRVLLRGVDAHEQFHDSVLSLLPSDSGTQMRRMVFSTAFVRDENGEVMSLICVFRELTAGPSKRGARDELGQEVEELAERVRAALQGEDDREEREVG
jgi:PAS domain S-box-containing protein